MATNTTNEGLVKPDGGDLYDITVFNATLDKLDAKITELRQTISSALSNEDGSITGSKLADNTIPSSKYATGSVNSNALADGSVTTQKIANDAVTVDKIAADAIGNEQLAQNAVAAENIVDGIVGTAKLTDGSVTAIKLANGSITPDKIAAGAITSDKIEAEFVKKLMNYVTCPNYFLDQSANVQFDGKNATTWRNRFSGAGVYSNAYGFVCLPRARGIYDEDTLYSLYEFEIKTGAQIISDPTLNPHSQSVEANTFYVRLKTRSGLPGPTGGVFAYVMLTPIFEKI